MAELNGDDYEAIAVALLRKGYTPEDIFPALEEAVFRVKHGGTEYRVYAARVIANMYQHRGTKQS